jgi:tetraacyldisaccharide 4'-kinase
VHPTPERPRAYPIVTTPARQLAAWLERGAKHRLDARLALATVWEKLADPLRAVALPRGASVVGVGGATLGGSGKTPVTLALAVALCRGCSGDPASRRNARAPVAVVASAHPARAARARRVSRDDRVARVGDEAIMLARALEPHGVPVIVGPRADALALAAELAQVVIVDSLLQTWPDQLACSILVLDADTPWGSGRCPPAGDLRALPERMVAATDVVLMRASMRASESSDARVTDLVQRHGKILLSWSSEVSGAVTRDGSERIALERLATLRLGVVLAIARPERVLDALERHGITPRAVWLAADHAAPRPKLESRVDAWLTSAKCATKLPERLGSAPVWTLVQGVDLPAELIARISVLDPRKEPRFRSD